MSYQPVADIATQVPPTAQRLVAELEPTAALLVDRHLAQANEWFSDESPPLPLLPRLLPRPHLRRPRGRPVDMVLAIERQVREWGVDKLDALTILFAGLDGGLVIAMPLVEGR
jgi:hypothetical protein